MKNDKLMLPEITSIQLFKLIKHIYPAEQVSVDRLNGIFGKSKVANAGVTGASIGILNRDKSTISLTEEGKQLGRALISKNLEEQRKILKELVLKNPALDFIYSLIKEKKIMKNKEIGQKIAMQFNKNWKHELSYSRYGTNCGDILAAAGLGDYVNGIYSIERIETNNITEGTSSPYLRFDKLLKILNMLGSKDKTLDESSIHLDTNKGRMSYELTNCIDLNLVKKTGDIFSITTSGRNLIHPLHNEEIQKNLFAEILRKSAYAKVIELIEQNKGIDRRKIGDILAHELRKEGNESTRYDWGKKFADWLIAAGISSIERSKRTQGKQKEKKTEHKKEKTKSNAIKSEQIPSTMKHKPNVFIPTTPIKSEQVNQNTTFMIGRLIERIEIKNSVKQDIFEDLKELIKICENDNSLKSYISLLKSHSDLYSEIKDFRIIEADLNYLKERFNH